MKAALDVGTNSVRLFVAKVYKDRLEPVLKEVRVTRLGQGVDHNQLLDQKAMERTLAALAELVAQIPAGVPTAIVATSAVRDGKNGSEFAQLVLERTGIPLQVLTGVQEGKLSFRGAVFSLANLTLADPMTIVDIGGGSTEIYTGTKQGELLAGDSLQLGAVRLLERFPQLDSQMREAIVTTLSPLTEINLRFKPQTLVALGGTATSLAVIIQDLPKYSEEKIAGFSFSLAELESCYTRLGKLSVAERRKIPSLQAGREDVIVYGAAILVEVMKLMGFTRVYIALGDLLYGALKCENMAIFDS